MNRSDVIVVGAGISGLTAAWRLAQAGQRVKVIEANKRVGGRTLNHRFASGEVVEVGGQWVGPTQERILSLLAELGLSTYPQWNQGDNLTLFGNRLRPYRGAIPKLPPYVLLDVLQAHVRLDRMAREIPLSDPSLHPKAELWDSLTFAEWLRRNVRTATGRKVFELMSGAVLAASPHDLSFLHVLFYIHSGTNLDTLLGVEGGAQQDRIHGGSQRISETLAERIADVITGEPVRTVRQNGSSVELITDRGTHQAARVIFAVPPTQLLRITQEPLLPSWRDQLLQRLPQGSVIKCMALYDTPFWRDKGLSGQATSEIGPVRLTSTIASPTPDAACCWALSKATKRASGTPGLLTSAAARCWSASPATSASRRSSRRITWTNPGPRNPSPGAVMPPCSRRDCGAAARRACANPTGVCTSPAQKRRRAGWDISTEP